LELINDSEKLAKMKKLARKFAQSRSWDMVFKAVYQAYAETYAIALAEKDIK
jgi:hypothetical protein